MSAVAVLEPKLISAIQQVVEVLSQTAAFEMDAEVAERMRELGEKKDACSAEERDEHRRWAEIWRRGTLQKLRAINALQQLHEQAPELVTSVPAGSDAA